MQKTHLTWKNITLESKGKKIIKDESSSISTGSLTALLGTSGAGKTTLLNALAGRVPKSMNINGSILLDGKERNKERWVESIAYVEQFFYAYENQTVFETIKFSALLKTKRGDEHKSTEETFANVTKIINTLGLGGVKDNYLCHISGGELKRVSIGLELIGNPKIIFLDEPTSGLDSFSALNMTRLLKRLSNDNKIILLTIHQPSYVISNLFDEIFIIAKGNTVFQGNMTKCIEFFSEKGYVVPPNTNPCDYFLELTSVNTNSDDEALESHIRIDKLMEAWKDRKKNIESNKIYKENGLTNKSTEKGDNYDEISTERNNDCSEPNRNSKLDSLKQFYFNFIKRNSFPHLLKRNMVELYRDERFIKVQILQKVVFTLLLGLSYLQLGYSPEAIESRTGVIFFILINVFFSTCGSIFNVFPGEKKIIMRERKSGLYNGFSVYASKFVSLAIYNAFFTLLYLTAVYWMIGLNPNAGRFFIYLIIQISALLFSIALGLTIGTVCPTEISAQILGTTILIVFNIFGGVFNNPKTIPDWLRWIIWISPINYSFRASMKNQYYGLDFDGISGESVVKVAELSKVSVWWSILILWLLTLGWGLAGAFSLHFLTRIRLKLKE